MKNIYFLFFAILPFNILAQDLFSSSDYHLETLDCPESMICEARNDDKHKLIFFQVFDKEGRLHEEYLRTSDSTFLYKSFHLMDHFNLIKKPSIYGQKSAGILLISNIQSGQEKESIHYDNYEAYTYHDTLLIPIGNWTVRDHHGKLKERVELNMQGENHGIWDTYEAGWEKIKRNYESDSLTNIFYVDEMAKEPEAREIIKRIQGTWYVYSKWENRHMENLAIGEKLKPLKSEYSSYTFTDNNLKINSFEKGKKVGKTENYKLSIKDNEVLVIMSKTQNSELEVLYLSDSDFRLLPIEY